MARIEVSGDWEEPVHEGLVQLFEERLGPAIAGDAHRYCPKRTGALADSIEHHLDEHGDLIVSASGDGEHEYAAYVELGTEPHIIRAHGPYSLHNRETGQYFGPVVHHPGTRPRPFLRPALFRERGE